jgi:hypothetical protein
VSDPAPRELRDGSAVLQWLGAGAWLRGADPEPERRAALDALADAVIAACSSELPALPPAGAIADLVLLLAGAPLARGGAGAAPHRYGIDPALRAAVQAYQDDVLSRLQGAPRFDDARAAFAHVPAELAPQAAALLVGALWQRCGGAGAIVSPGALRRALARPPAERAAAGRAALADPAQVAQLTAAYRALARGARQRRALVEDRDVFAIDHVQALGAFSHRLAAEHLAAAADAIAAELPRRVPARRGARGARQTQLLTDDTYPAGGFAAIEPGGAATRLDNVVGSELIYLGEAISPERGGGAAAALAEIDLFALRFAEGELLCYSRDESVLRRHRHAIAIVLAADVGGARVKDAGAPWQRLTLALGLIVALIRWLSAQLGHEALAVRLALPPGELATEHAILAILLAPERASGRVELAWASAADALAALEAQAAVGEAIADALILSLGPPPPVPPGLRALHVSLAAAQPALREIGPRPRAAAAVPSGAAAGWTDWGGAAEEVLRWLV